MLRIMLLGCPGAGKGTQSEYISQHYAIPKIATGDMLRAAVAAETSLGLQAKEYMDNGQLVPDDVIIGMVKERISQADCQQGFLFDGFPRTLAQAQALIDADIKLDYVIEIAVESQEIVKRLTGRRVHPASGRVYHVDFNPPKVADQDDNTGEPLIQRDDDTDATVLKRLKVYDEQTKPLIIFYQQLVAEDKNLAPVYQRIDGAMSVAAVREAISTILG